MACIFLLFCGTAIASHAQSFTVLVEFGGGNGEEPYGPLMQATDGNLYGTTTQGGTYGYGTAFRLSTAGEFTSLHSFDKEDGSDPSAPLVQGGNGNLYGADPYFGGQGSGDVFEMTLDGLFRPIYGFCPPADCMGPQVALTAGADGNFYGVTPQSGAERLGTVFSVTPSGEVMTLYTFCSVTGCPGGFIPYTPLVLGTNGNLYGTTSSGGANNAGAFYEITPAGQLTTLYSFCSLPNCADGTSYFGALVLATDGNFYDTTADGGASNYGTVFRITPQGQLTVIYSFCALANCADGRTPQAGLVQGSDGKFYGTTNAGGQFGFGTIFEINAAGKLNTLHNFNGTDAEYSLGLMQATNGTFYGTSASGGRQGSLGTVYSLSVGLGPFVKTQLSAGHVGDRIIILGDSLTGSTAVSFNSTPATFTVVSDTEITATVPEEATMGFVRVDTSGVRLTSNAKFGVIQ
jgi:uncharacterized repeat protein (TIGR03803 family)